MIDFSKSLAVRYLRETIQIEIYVINSKVWRKQINYALNKGYNLDYIEFMIVQSLGLVALNTPYFASLNLGYLFGGMVVSNVKCDALQDTIIGEYYDNYYAIRSWIDNFNQGYTVKLNHSLKDLDYELAMVNVINYLENKRKENTNVCDIHKLRYPKNFQGFVSPYCGELF